MASLGAPPLALYVHFPWCVRKCPYCDFNSYTLHGELAPAAYVARLMRDIEAQAPQVAGREVGSVFFGGGTPSLFAPEAIGRVLESARRHLHVAPDAEVTLEANPGAIERGAFREYRAAGVTRVSLGAQSFEARALRALGRIHSPEDTQRAAAELHAAGIGNFNVDLMYGLPGQELAGAVRDIEEALALYPAHLSHYHLTLESGTPFAARPPPLPAEELAEGKAFLLWLAEDHFTMLGYRCHDLVTVDGQDALRIVAGSSLGILRETGTKDVAASFAALPPRRSRRHWRRGSAPARSSTTRSSTTSRSRTACVTTRTGSRRATSPTRPPTSRSWP